MTTTLQQRKKHPGGRPPKFAEPRKPVTVTLPERTLGQLADISPDRAKAIVKVTDAAMNLQESGGKLVQVVNVAPGVGLILVGPNRYLRKIAWLRMAEIVPTRFILSIPPGKSVDSLEVALGDLYDVIPARETRERKMIEDLLHLIQRLRRTSNVSQEEILLINTRKLPGLSP